MNHLSGLLTALAAQARRREHDQRAWYARRLYRLRRRGRGRWALRFLFTLAAAVLGLAVGLLAARCIKGGAPPP